MIGGTLSSHVLAQFAVGPGVGPGGLENTVQQLVETDFGSSNNASVQISLIPEPGTALLVGLGVAGLATVTRRTARRA